MGGYGSGRPGSGKATTDDFRQLDLRKLNRAEWLREGVSSVLTWTNRGEKTSSIGMRMEQDTLVLTYRNQPYGGEWESLEYGVKIERTPCHFGGERLWFRCPGVRCGRRAAVLYSRRYFVCRKCLRLTYECQNESPAYRTLRKAQNIRERVCGWGGTMDPFPGKPKGMHWKTYRKLEWKEALAHHLADRLMFGHTGLDPSIFEDG